MRRDVQPNEVFHAFFMPYTLAETVQSFRVIERVNEGWLVDVVWWRVHKGNVHHCTRIFSTERLVELRHYGRTSVLYGDII